MGLAKANCLAFFLNSSVLILEFPQEREQNFLDPQIVFGSKSFWHFGQFIIYFYLATLFSIGFDISNFCLVHIVVIMPVCLIGHRGSIPLRGAKYCLSSVTEAFQSPKLTAGVRLPGGTPNLHRYGREFKSLLARHTQVISRYIGGVMELVVFFALEARVLVACRFESDLPHH